MFAGTEISETRNQQAEEIAMNTTKFNTTKSPTLDLKSTTTTTTTSDEPRSPAKRGEASGSGRDIIISRDDKDKE